MKKCLLFVLFIISLCSCEQKHTYKDNNSNVSFTNVIKFKYENHSYILFENMIGSFVSQSVVHDPGCPCLKDSTFKK